MGPYGSKISKRCSFYNFYLTRTNLYDKKGSHEGISMFWRFVLPKLKHVMAFWFFFRNMGAYRTGILKSYSSYSFHPISAKLYEDFDYHGRIQAITYLGNWQSLKKLMTLWNFVIGVNGIRKSWKLLIVERSGWKFGTSGPIHCIMFSTFHVKWFELSLGSFGTVCKISDVKISKRLLLSQFSFDFNQT